MLFHQETLDWHNVLFFCRRISTRRGDTRYWAVPQLIQANLHFFDYMRSKSQAEAAKRNKS